MNETMLINELKIFAKHLRVLIVEDEDELREELKSFLDCFFYRVDEAYDGQDGLNKYKNNKYDIVITDLRMPNMSGLEFSKEVKLLNKNQIIMVLSGYIDEFVIELIDIGIDALILKPYKLETFLQKLLKHSENIVLQKDFEKMIVDKSFKKYTNKELSADIFSEEEPLLEEKAEAKVVVKSIDTIADEITNSKSIEDSIEKFKENHVKSHEIDTTMWKYMCEDIENLNNEYEEVINNIMLHKISQEHVEKLSSIFGKYHQNLSLINELNELAHIFLELSNTLYDLDINELDQDHLEVFDMFEFIYQDILNFFYVVFINNETENINYLTDSLNSSVMQFKMKAGLIQEDEDDLELF